MKTKKKFLQVDTYLGMSDICNTLIGLKNQKNLTLGNAKKYCHRGLLEYKAYLAKVVRSTQIASFESSSNQF